MFLICQNVWYYIGMVDLSNDSMAQYELLQQSGVLALLEQLRQESTQLQCIIKDMNTLVSFNDIESMLDYMISRLLDYLVPENLVFMVKRPHTNTLQQYYYKRLQKTDDTLNERFFYCLKEYFDSNIEDFFNGKPVPFSSIKDDLVQLNVTQTLKMLQPQYFIPIIGAEGTCGVVIFGNKITPEPYNKMQLYYIQNMFTVFSVSLQNEINYKSSITDAKTGLYSYDYLVNRIKEKIASAKRHDISSGILMLDIDHFKNFNDTYGHLAGDKVLVELSKALLSYVREEDCIGRFGGEEFVILLSDCKKESLFFVAERIRTGVESLRVQEKDTVLNITVSIGGCMITSESEDTPKEIIEKIDKALYASKEGGRNRTTIAE